MKMKSYTFKINCDHGINWSRLYENLKNCGGDFRIVDISNVQSEHYFCLLIKRKLLADAELAGYQRNCRFEPTPPGCYFYKTISEAKNELKRIYRFAKIAKTLLPITVYGNWPKKIKNSEK